MTLNAGWTGYVWGRTLHGGRLAQLFATLATSVPLSQAGVKESIVAYMPWGFYPKGGVPRLGVAHAFYDNNRGQLCGLWIEPGGGYGNTGLWVIAFSQMTYGRITNVNLDFTYSVDL